MTATTDYAEFLANKPRILRNCGFSVDDASMNSRMFDWQRLVTRWAIRKGRAALFEGCGLGKTVQELEWGTHVHRHTQGDVLLLAPLAVAEQTHSEEAPKFGYSTTLCRKQSDVRSGINITNYEMMEHFDPSKFSAVILDESSILKSMGGATKTALIEQWAGTPYRLCATATPAPNDYMELGNHAEFLGVMSRVEMLSMFFVHDGGDTGQWRLKGHAEDKFWKWVCSWAVVIRKPSDIGYSDDGYILPPMRRIQVTVPADGPNEGYLIPMEAKTLRERQSARRLTIAPRVKACADVVNASTKQWIIWCGLNDESEALTKAIPDAVEVTGSDSYDHKVATMKAFKAKLIRVVVTKIAIWGFGANLQNCSRWFHVGLSDSFEQMYQADHRCLRFGQDEECECYIVTSELEGAVVRNLDRKEKDFEKMNEGMVMHMRDEMDREIHGATVTQNVFENAVKSGDGWTVILGDCAEELRKLPTASVHYSIFSPPFASLYTYSASDRDMGNAKDHAEFMQHFSYAVGELRRVVMPGRLVSFHCMNLPSSKERDGYIGIKDFRGDLIRLFESHGFIYHSEVLIWKDPLVAASRTHALGLAHKQIVKDAAMCRMGIPDYLVTMRVPGDNPEPVKHGGVVGDAYRANGFQRYIGMAEDEPRRERTPDARTNKYSHEVWQRYASPVWMDINPSDTLQRESAREERDERHICPLQLQVIRRGIELWTKPGDVVLDPFGGIGSTGYVAVQEGRKSISMELKRSYWEQNWKNHAEAVKSTQFGLFADVPMMAEPCEDAAATAEYLESPSSEVITFGPYPVLEPDLQGVTPGDAAFWDSMSDIEEDVIR
jgi:hypothetical protein